MDVFVFFLIVGLILLMGVLVSVRLNNPESMMRGRIRRIRRLRRVRAVPGAVGAVPAVPGVVSAVPVDTVIEEIIDEVEPEPEEEEV
jgi:hypothetical protein